MKQIADRLGDEAELLGFVKVDSEPGAATHAVFREPDSLYFAAPGLDGGIFNDGVLEVRAEDEITLKTGKRRGGGNGPFCVFLTLPSLSDFHVLLVGITIQRTNPSRQQSTIWS